MATAPKRRAKQRHAVPQTVRREVFDAVAEIVIEPYRTMMMLQRAVGLRPGEACRNGTVRVTLTVRKAAMGGAVYASDTGRSIASIIFQSVPAATHVTVRDADRSLIDLYDRQ